MDVESIIVSINQIWEVLDLNFLWVTSQSGLV